MRTPRKCFSGFSDEGISVLYGRTVTTRQLTDSKGGILVSGFFHDIPGREEFSYVEASLGRVGLATQFFKFDKVHIVH